MIRLTRKLETGEGGGEYATLTLPFDQRNKSRQRVILDNGEEAALLLPRGAVLRTGDRLGGEVQGHAVRVCAADETLSLVVCPDRLLLNRVCYHLGNRHVPLQIGPDRVSYRHDHVLDDMVRGLGGTPVRLQAPFQPESGAYGHGGHRHAHG